MKKFIIRAVKFIGRKSIVKLAAFIISLGLIAIGTWRIYPPAALVLVGGIILFDLYFERAEK